MTRANAARIESRIEPASMRGAMHGRALNRADHEWLRTESMDDHRL
jgi:hypothetical protein